MDVVIQRRGPHDPVGQQPQGQPLCSQLRHVLAVPQDPVILREHHPGHQRPQAAHLSYIATDRHHSPRGRRFSQGLQLPHESLLLVRFRGGRSWRSGRGGGGGKIGERRQRRRCRYTQRRSWRWWSRGQRQGRSGSREVDKSSQVEPGVVLDEKKKVTNVPFLAEQNAYVPPAIHHQQGVEETGRRSLHGPHRHLEVERILWRDGNTGTGVMGGDVSRRVWRKEGEEDLKRVWGDKGKGARRPQGMDTGASKERRVDGGMRDVRKEHKDNKIKHQGDEWAQRVFMGVIWIHLGQSDRKHLKVVLWRHNRRNNKMEKEVRKG